MTDMVNHPPHYSVLPNLIEKECIEYTRDMMFDQGNAFKYVYRLGSKNDAKEDADKAIWYLGDAIKYSDYIEVEFKVTNPDFMTIRTEALYYIAMGEFYRAILILNIVDRYDLYSTLDEILPVNISE